MERFGAPSKSDVTAWLTAMINTFNNAGYLSQIDPDGGAEKLRISFREKTEDTFVFTVGVDDREEEVLTLVWHLDFHSLKETERQEQQKFDEDCAELEIPPDEVRSNSALSEAVASLQTVLPGPYLSIRTDCHTPEGYPDAECSFPLDFNQFRNAKARIVVGLLQGCWGCGLIGFSEQSRIYVDERGRDILSEMDASINPMPLGGLEGGKS